MLTASQRDLTEAARHPAGSPAAAELLSNALAAEGIVRIERLLIAAVGDAPIELRDAGVSLVAAGGKRLRPLLTLLSARAAQAAPGSKRHASGRIALALAGELAHSATLLHDDVIDDGLTRRGLPAPRVAYGNGVSVLAGDWMLSTALDMALRSRVRGAIETLLRTVRELVAGEARQLVLRGNAAFSSADALWISRMKTGAIFGYCAEAGGLAARAPDRTVLALRAFGLACGTAFQISDDLLDFEADAATLGKAVLADVAEGKASLPVALALEEVPALRGELRALLHEQLGESSSGLDTLLSARMRAFAGRIMHTGALAEARRIAQRERDVALTSLHTLPPSRARELLVMVAAMLVDRTR